MSSPAVIISTLRVSPACNFPIILSQIEIDIDTTNRPGYNRKKQIYFFFTHFCLNFYATASWKSNALY